MGSAGRRAVGVAGALLLLFGPLAVAAPPPAGAPAPDVSTPLRGAAALAGAVSPLVTDGRARYLGPAAGASPLALTVTLQAVNAAALQTYVQGLDQAGSPSYHTYLTPAAFSAAFAPPASSLDAVEAFLRAGGLQVGPPADGGLAVGAAGSVAEVEALFQLRMGEYAFDGATALANLEPAVLPGDLQGLVLGISGLNTFQTLAPAHLSPALAAAAAEGGQATADPGASGPFTPPELRTAYGLDPASRAGVTGTGQRIALIDDSALLPSDVSAFDQAFGITAPAPLQVPVDGGGGASDIETTLDAEWAQAAAPGATVVVYEVPALADQDIEDALQAAVSASPAAAAVSMSFGGPEDLQGADFVAAMHQLLIQAVAEGLTPLAASGDEGICGSTIEFCPDVSYPAADGLVTAVGGTALQLNADDTVQAETAWPGSGGGRSDLFTSLNGALQPPLSAQRSVPDVASDAVDLEVYYQGAWWVADGTSFGSPFWAGIVALAAQQASRPVGFLNPALYALGTSAAGPLHDITLGCQSAEGTGLPVQCAASGWDDVTGLGSPAAWALVQAVAAAGPAAAPEPHVAAVLVEGGGSATSSTTEVVLGSGFGPAQAAGVIALGGPHGDGGARALSWSDSEVTFNLDPAEVWQPVGAGTWWVQLYPSGGATRNTFGNFTVADQLTLAAPAPATPVAIGPPGAASAQAVTLGVEDPWGSPIPSASDQIALAVSWSDGNTPAGAGAASPLTLYADAGLTQRLQASAGVYRVAARNGQATVYAVSTQSGQATYSALDLSRTTTGWVEATGSFSPGPRAALAASPDYASGVTASPASTALHPVFAPLYVAPVDANGNFVAGSVSGGTVALTLSGITGQVLVEQGGTVVASIYGPAPANTAAGSAPVSVSFTAPASYTLSEPTFSISDTAADRLSYTVTDAAYAAGSGTLQFSPLASLGLSAAGPTAVSAGHSPQLQLVTVSAGLPGGPPLLSGVPPVELYVYNTASCSGADCSYSWDANGQRVVVESCASGGSACTPLTAAADGGYPVSFSGGSATLGVTSSLEGTLYYAAAAPSVAGVQAPPAQGSFVAGPPVGGLLGVLFPHAAAGSGYQAVAVELTDAAGALAAGSDQVGLSIAGASGPLTVASYNPSSGRDLPLTPSPSGAYVQDLAGGAAVWYVAAAAADTLTYTAADRSDPGLAILPAGGGPAQGIFVAASAGGSPPAPPTAPAAITLTPALPYVNVGGTLALSGLVSNALGEPLPGMQVDLTATSGSIAPPVAVTGAAGTYQATFTAPDAPIRPLLTATVAGTALRATVPVTVAVISGGGVPPSGGGVPPSGGAPAAPAAPAAPPVNQPATQTAAAVTETVDTAQGAVVVATSGAGLQLALPQGSLSGQPTLTVGQVASSGLPPAGGVGAQLASAVWSISAGSAEPAAPVQATFAYQLPAGVSSQQLALYTLLGGQWQYYTQGVLDTAAGTITAPLGHFSTWAVLAVPAAYSDVPVSSWAFRDIADLSARGIAAGLPGGRFDPNGPLTRAEFLKLLFSAVGLQVQASATPAFTDETPGAWDQAYLDTAAQDHILLGSGGQAQPDAAIARQEAAVLLVRTLAASRVTLPAGSPASFTDAAQIASWAQGAVGQAAAAGLIQGYPDGSFGPLQTLTRAEGVALVVRVLGLAQAGID